MTKPDQIQLKGKEKLNQELAKIYQNELNPSLLKKEMKRESQQAVKLGELNLRPDSNKYPKILSFNNDPVSQTTQNFD